jgi:hypothetical protein
MIYGRRAAALALRQRELLVHSGALRAQLVIDAAVLQRPLALADRVREGWRWLRANPEAPIAALVVLAVLRPRRVLRWGLRIWTGWRSLRRLQRWVAAIR